MRRVAEQPSPYTSCAPYGDDAKKRFRFQSLFQDYMELLKETEEKKRRLVETRQKKRRLLAEVRFLRRKYETLSANQCQQFRLKEPSHAEPVINAQPGNNLVLSGKPPTGKTSWRRPTESLCAPQSLGLFIPREVPPQDMRVMEAANASTSATLGVSEVAFKNGQEMNQVHFEQNHMQMERFSRVPMIGGGSKEKLAICREFGNNSKKIGKRKLSWRDPLVLEV